MPTLYIIGGANGCGKTTWYTTALLNGFVNSNLPFLNVDLIAKNELGGYNEINLASAQMIARERIGNYLALHQDFMIESNLATEADYNWIEGISKKGYEIVLYFLGTFNTQINIERVARRISEGGHAVAESIILHRYSIGLSYLKTKIRHFDHVFLIDNSTEYPVQYAHLEKGKIILLLPNHPAWVQDVLQIVIRLVGSKD